MRVVFCFLMLAGFGVGEIVAAAKKPLPKPLRALLITGGCCHDYVKQKDILKQGLERRLNIVIVHAHSPNKSTKPPLKIYGNADYAKGYDIVIHDECSAGISDPKIIAGVLAPHRKGIPGVNLHCAMHSYRFGNFRAKVKLTDANAKWFEYIGLQSARHGPQQAIVVAYENNVPFITEGAKAWTTQREELYNNIQIFPTAKVVARGTQGKAKAVVAWTNDYHGTRVFSTSLGHNNVTVADARYLDLVARGILWATKKEDWPVAMPKNESFDLNSKPKPKSSKSTKPKKPKKDGGIESAFRKIKAPKGFKLSLFAQPPLVNYPVCITAASTGELFVGIDEQGSLGKAKGRGRVVRCIDTNGDGVADKINTFAKMDHPRGLIYDNGKLWVLHPPFLTLYEDTNGDGVADKEKRLINGISTEYVNKRGADHTTNGIRMGIDGWIYIAVGDFGFTKAVGADGRVLSRRGGGIVRVRPDGTDLEIYCWGTRNILDACIDPYLNIFTRDNTNDGGGWNVRFSHNLQSAEYGYPSWYKNYATEIMPTLKDYGGGSGCGGMFYHDTRWPAPFGHAVYTCDWGRSVVYRHNPPANGATFDAHQETFLAISRPTDIDVDASGRMYVASWHGGKFAYSGPNVGYVVQLVPENYKPEVFPDVTKLTDAKLFNLLIGPSQQQNLHAQFELKRRGPSAARIAKLNALAADKSVPLAGRVAAIFTLKQINGAKAQNDLLKLAGNADIAEFALRALTDRKGELKGLKKDIFVNALNSKTPRLRAQALISLGRLGDASATVAILPHAAAPKLAKQPSHNAANPIGVIPHLATRTLVALRPVDALLDALDGTHGAAALSVLKYIHDDKVVATLTARAAKNPDLATLATLVRLYHRESKYTSGWWGTRPDTSGPYFAREKWSGSAAIETGLKTALAKAPKATVDLVKAQLAKHKVVINGLPTGTAVAAINPDNAPFKIAQPTGDPKTWIATIGEKKSTERALKAKGNAARGKKLFTSQACIACHTTADGQTPKGPHLVDIGKRYKPTELLQSILNPNAVVAQGFDTYVFTTRKKETHVGFVTSESADTISIRTGVGVAVDLPKTQIAKREKIAYSSMPPGLTSAITPEQLADLLAYLQSLKSK